jgi:hypothetical protein
MTTRAPQTGGLRLPGDIGIGQQDAEHIAGERDTLPYVDARLKMSGMQISQEPNIEYLPITAEQLLVPDAKSYITTHTAHLRWYNHIVRILADVRAELLQVENEMGDIGRKKREHFRGLDAGKKKSDRMTAQMMTDIIESDPTYHVLAIRQQELQQLKFKIDAWAEEVENNLKVISRQVETRKIESEAGNRSANMPGHARGRWEDPR